jgi:hypothetical protein
VLFVVIAVVFSATWFLPRHTSSEAVGRWRPKFFRVPGGLFKIFVTSAAAVTTGYSLGALIMSLGAQIAHDLIGSGNTLVNGAIAILSMTAMALASRRSSRLASGSLATA